MRKVLAAILMAAATVYCSGNDPTRGADLPQAPTPPANAQSVTITRLAPTDSSLTQISGINEPARLVVRDAATWADTWARIWQAQTPAPPLPAADFTREMLVVAAAGTRSAGGYAIVIESAYRDGDALHVVVRTDSPTGCLGIAAITAPVDVARVARTQDQVRFEEKTVTRPC